MNQPTTQPTTTDKQAPSLVCKSEYLTVPDGTRIAVSYWLDKNDINTHTKRPAIVTTTRYWRAHAYKDDKLEYENFYKAASFFCSKGYVFVAVDVRGTGASFGCHETEISDAEIADIGPIVDWVSQQAWCNGQVATEGTSYTANTTLCSLVTAPSALKLGVCRAPDFDAYRHLIAPGGIVNHWFIDTWGRSSAARDNNDAKTLYAVGYSSSSTYSVDNVLGVRPVDADTHGTLLAQAVAEHRDNYTIVGKENTMHYSDNPFYDIHRAIHDPEYQQCVEQSQIPLVIRCGWYDGGTQLGALAMYTSFDCPIRVIIDPWNHAGNKKADPLQAGDSTGTTERTMDEVRETTLAWLDRFLKPGNSSGADLASVSGIDYYTYGENRWKSTEVWPLPNTNRQRWYLAESNQLSQSKPIDQQGNDRYQVDATTTTGLNNRWFAQSPTTPILFPDRREADKKLLVYDTPPLEQDTEITGHPVVHLQLSTTATDGQFYVYLETIDPDGRVRMITDGQLRGMHRKVSKDIPPYHMFGPYHSLKKQDACPMVPGEITEIAFDLFPISIVLKKGQRLRIAIAGADKDVFGPIPGCEEPLITVERNAVHSSYLELPIIPSSTLSE